MNAQAVFERLPWDSTFFGFPIGRLTVPRVDSAIASEVAGWARAERLDCVYILTDAGDEAERSVATAAGCRAVDERLTIRKAMTVADLPPPDPRLRPARAEDIPTLRRIASISHYDSRFYKDPGFPRSRCDELYAHWVESSVRGAADHTLVAEVDGRVLGYMTAKRERPYGRLCLMAVDPDARGTGLGRSLTVDMIRWFVLQGLHGGYLTTQGGDTIANKLYERLSFEHIARQYWYHYWPARTSP